MLRIVKKIWILLFVVGSLTFIIRYLYNQVDRLNGSFHLSLYFLAIAGALQLAYWVVAVQCWQKIVALSTNCSINFLQGFSHLALTALGKYFPGKIWGMVARTTLMKQQGIALHQSVRATLQEQYLTLHASALISAALLFALQPTTFTAILCILSVASTILIVPFQRKVFSLVARLVKKSWRQELQEATPLTFKQMHGLLAGYSLVWLAVGLIFSCIYFALFPVAPSLPVVMRLILANTVGITLGFFAIFSPGGLGVREAVTGGLLVSQMSLEDALLLSLIFRLWIVASEILSGVALLAPNKLTGSRERT